MTLILIASATATTIGWKAKVREGLRGFALHVYILGGR